MKRFPVTWAAASLLLLLCGVGVSSLVSGPVSVSSWAVLQAAWDALLHGESQQLDLQTQTVVLQLRLPRLLLALLVGALLAQCGAVMQGLFRNPLADPGITGVSTGAALGAIVAIACLPPAQAVWVTPVAAFVGGLVVTLLVYGLARSAGSTSVALLLLAGVALSALGGALIGYISYVADDRVLRDITVWQMGSLAGAAWRSIVVCAVVLLVLMLVFQRHAQALNALALGEAEARHLGIEVGRLTVLLIVATAVGVGVGVAASGIIGFVGLIVPHAVRLTVGPDHRALLWLSALSGALLLALADLFARTAVTPAELPVGLVTALLGAPFFLGLLLQQRQRLLVGL